MARETNRLNVKIVARESNHGRHADGGGLFLNIAAGGSKTWVFCYRSPTHRIQRTGKSMGRPREMGLGSVEVVPLAIARDRAHELRKMLDDGLDPLDVAPPTPPKPKPTFGEVADRFVADMQGQWRNEKHRAQWASTLKQHAAPLRDIPVDQITVEHVLAVLKPLWLRVPETASRLRGRIERVLNAAKAAGHRSGENPAAWANHLENLLPARQKLTRGHHKALGWRELPDFMAKLRNRTGVAALAVEFAILTAARSGEVRGARWDEFDLEQAIWTIPASRMKAGREHRCPLVPRAVEIIETMAKLPRDEFVFPGQRTGSPMSDMTLTAVLKRMKVDATIHGFRSAFKTWATDQTSFANELSEAALAHIVGDTTERAYARGDRLARRRELMMAWAQFCEPSAADDNKVTSLFRTGAA